MKKYLPHILLGLVLFAGGFLTSRSCGGPDSKYWMRVAVHDQAMNVAATEHTINLAEIRVLKADNAQRVTENVTLRRDVTTANAKIVSLTHTIIDLAATEPSTTPDIEALPIVINLRARVARLTEGFSLAQITIGDQDKIIANLELVVKNTEKIAADWEADYNRSQALLATERSLRLTSEKKWKRTSLLAKAETVVITGGVGYFGGKALGHVLKLW